MEVFRFRFEIITEAEEASNFRKEKKKEERRKKTKHKKQLLQHQGTRCSRRM
jgi:hypothetical protein